MLTVFFGYDYQTWVWTNTFREIFSVTSGPDLLNLWSYPNLFFRPGKELCDLLVVCGDEILVFSDKTIAWPTVDDFSGGVVPLVSKGYR